MTTYEDTIEDELAGVDEVSNSRVGTLAVEETLVLYDVLKWGWYVEAADTIEFTDAVSNILSIPVVEVLGMFDSVVDQWKGTETVSEQLTVLDFSAIAKVFFDVVEDSVSLADLPKPVLELVLVESLVLSASAIANGKYQHNVEEFLNLLDEASRAFFLEIADSLGIADSQLITYVANAVLSDSVAVTDETSYGFTATETIEDSFVASDSVSVMQKLYELILDGFQFEVAVELDGEVYECWVLNTDEFHPSVYSGFNFNSFAVQEGTLFAANDTGIYKLTGTTDAGEEFHSGLVLSETDFGVPNKKRLRVVWFGMSGKTAVLRTTADGISRTYAVTGAKAYCNRDVHGTKWTLTLEDFETLNSIDLLPVILYKR